MASEQLVREQRETMLERLHARYFGQLNRNAIESMGDLVDAVMAEPWVRRAVVESVVREAADGGATIRIDDPGAMCGGHWLATADLLTSLFPASPDVR